MKRLMPFVLAFFFACGPGTSNNQDGNNGNGDPNVDGTFYDESVGGLADSLILPTGAAHQTSIEFVRAATGDFATGPGAMPSDADVAAADQKFDATIAAHLNFISACHGYVKDAVEMGVVGQGLRPDGKVTRRQPLLLAVAGVGLMAVAGYGYISNMFNERAKPVADRIADSTDAEHARIKELLGVSTDLTREQTLEYFNNDIGFLERNNKVQEIEQDFTTSGEADIRAFGAEVNQAMANTANRAGEAAVNLVVSGNTAAAGGQGYSQVAEHVGKTSAFTAGLIDFGISAVSTVTGVPLQPLDYLSAKLNTMTVSEKKKEVLVGEPRVPMSVDEALDVVEDGYRTKTVKEVDSAVATLVDDILDDLGDLAEVSDAGNGYRSVQVPQTLHITTFEDVTNETTFQQLEVGTADMFVHAEGFRPQSYDDVTVADGGSVEYWVDVEGEPNNGSPNNGSPNNGSMDDVTVPAQRWNGLQIELTVEGGTLGTSRNESDPEMNRFLFEDGVLTADTVVVTGTISSSNEHSGDPEMAPYAEGDLALFDGTEQVPLEWTSGTTTGPWSQSFRAELDTTSDQVAFVTVAISLHPDGGGLQTLTLEAQLLREGVQRN